MIINLSKIDLKKAFKEFEELNKDNDRMLGKS